MEIFFAIIMIAAGAFSLAGAICNWDWFMNNYKARPFMTLFGRTGTRIIYGFIGVFIIAIAVAFLVVNY
ncbi:MAG: immunity 17 family protein [Ruminococcus sp.]|nr:immunity 17 family protein [Ruminococcus sp.]